MDTVFNSAENPCINYEKYMLGNRDSRMAYMKISYATPRHCEGFKKNHALYGERNKEASSTTF